jgi:hypothetical protein
MITPAECKAARKFLGRSQLCRQRREAGVDSGGVRSGGQAGVQHAGGHLWRMAQVRSGQVRSGQGTKQEHGYRRIRNECAANL